MSLPGVGLFALTNTPRTTRADPCHDGLLQVGQHRVAEEGEVRWFAQKYVWWW